MGRYIVTTRSHFTPFSYDELVRPVVNQTMAHNAAQDYYDALSMDTEALDNYISKDDEDERMSREMYDTYRSKLAALQNELNANGYSARTRGQLSEARNGYANSILTLQKALNRRQEQSKLYWDTAHKDQDTIMGIDPGTYGLDKYLNDENFGSDWFSYSGKQFMQEVAAEVQARAKEYVDMSYSHEVPGYITRIMNKGVTNKEINDAVDAVRNGTTDSLTGASKLLADVLVSRINATGAQKGVNISDAQYNRFLDYGSLGMTAGVVDPEYKDIKLDRTVSSGPRNTNDTQVPVGPQSFAQQLMTGNYDEVRGTVNKMAEPIQGEVGIHTPEGLVTVRSEAEATSVLYGGADVDDVMNKYGLRINIGAGDLFNTTDGHQYGTAHTQAGDISVRSTRLTRKQKKQAGLDPDKPAFGIEAFYNGDWQLHKEWTRDATEKLNNYNKRQKYLADKNPDLAIGHRGAVGRMFDKLNHKHDIAVDPYEAKQLRKKSPNLSDVSDSQILSLYTMQARLSNDTPAIIADENTRNILGQNLYNSWNRNLSNLSSKEGRQSPFAFYKVAKNNVDYDEVGEKDITKILANSGKGYKNGDLAEVYAYPTDILRNMVRFTGTGNGAWATNPESFGSIVAEGVSSMRSPNPYADLRDERGIQYSPIEELMLPILHPEVVNRMTRKQKVDWTNDYFSLVIPGYTKSPDISPVVDQMVWDPRFKTGLYMDTTDFIQEMLSGTRDLLGRRKK